MQCAVRSAQCAVRSVQRAACSVQCSVCSVQCAACSMQHAACSVQRAACSVQCAACSVQYTIFLSKPQQPSGQVAPHGENTNSLIGPEPTVVDRSLVYSTLYSTLPAPTLHVAVGFLTTLLLVVKTVKPLPCFCCWYTGGREPHSSSQLGLGRIQ